MNFHISPGQIDMKKNVPRWIAVQQHYAYILLRGDGKLQTQTACVRISSTGQLSIGQLRCNMFYSGKKNIEKKKTFKVGLLA